MEEAVALVQRTSVGHKITGHVTPRNMSVITGHVTPCTMLPYQMLRDTAQHVLI